MSALKRNILKFLVQLVYTCWVKNLKTQPLKSFHASSEIAAAILSEGILSLGLGAQPTTIEFNTDIKRAVGSDSVTHLPLARHRKPMSLTLLTRWDVVLLRKNLDDASLLCLIGKMATTMTI